MNIESNTSPETTKTLIERLFSVGAHFGFTKSRRHPTVTPFIFGNKLGTDIIDLEKTGTSLEAAKAVIKEVAKNGKGILFVGTKEEIINSFTRLGGGPARLVKFTGEYEVEE